MTYFGWRSVATALADTGISITNLKQAGRWKSDEVAEGYLENSTPQKNDRMSMLGAEEKESKKQKIYSQQEIPACRCCPPSTVQFHKTSPSFQYYVYY
eukprot:11585856-Ditylum_brightwellii.AAC.1